MITPIPLLQSVRVASPCNADWNEMQAVEGERVHFCMGCGKNVYNLSAMSQSEAEGLLRKHEGRLCVRYYQRRDGTVLTGDCPVGAQAVRMALIRRSAVAAGLFALMFGAMAGINRAEMKQAAPMGSVAVAPITQAVPMGAVTPVEEPTPEPVMGKMAVREPQATQGFAVTGHKLPSPQYETLKMGAVEITPPSQTLYNGPMDATQPASPADCTDEAILKPHK